MRLSKVVSAAMIVGALGFGALGPGGVVASADPVAPAPLKPGHDDFCPPWCGNGNGNGHGNGNGPDWKHWDGDKGPWWAGNRHEWWDDRNGAPPWGWGPPPAYQWAGGPPHPFNYWGYNVNPEWNDGFGQWGIWLFGLWIPVFGIGVQ
jgi:hypothetical protein